MVRELIKATNPDVQVQNLTVSRQPEKDMQEKNTSRLLPVVQMPFMQSSQAVSPVTKFA